MAWLSRDCCSRFNCCCLVLKVDSGNDCDAAIMNGFQGDAIVIADVSRLRFVASRAGSVRRTACSNRSCTSGYRLRLLRLSAGVSCCRVQAR